MGRKRDSDDLSVSYKTGWEAGHKTGYREGCEAMLKRQEEEQAAAEPKSVTYMSSTDPAIVRADVHRKVDEVFDDDPYAAIVMAVYHHQEEESPKEPGVILRKEDDPAEWLRMDTKG